jgi:hypothetical protein
MLNRALLCMLALPGVVCDRGFTPGRNVRTLDNHPDVKMTVKDITKAGGTFTRKVRLHSNVSHNLS